MPYFIYRVFPFRRLELRRGPARIRRRVGAREGAARRPGPAGRLHDQGDFRGDENTPRIC